MNESDTPPLTLNLYTNFTFYFVSKTPYWGFTFEPHSWAAPPLEVGVQISHFSKVGVQGVQTVAQGYTSGYSYVVLD